MCAFFNMSLLFFLICKVVQYHIMDWLHNSFKNKLLSICFSLSNLQSVELRENILRTLPPSFALLTKLERLDLGSNEFTELVSVHKAIDFFFFFF